MTFPRLGQSSLSGRLLLIRERADAGFYDSGAVIGEIVQALLDTFFSRRASNGAL